MTNPTTIATISIPALPDPLTLDLKTTKSWFVLGRNGTGKSALIHFIVTNLINSILNLVYVPGSRPSYFEGDSLNMTAMARNQYASNSKGWDSMPDIRIRPISGTSRNERAIFDLQSAEFQYKIDAANDVELHGKASAAIERLQHRLSPLNQVNSLLAQANLPVSIVVEGGELKAKRDNEIYSISKMSDGERIALIIIAEVISAKPGSLFLIDEPELHMHQSIVVPLIASLIKTRSDCAIVVSTHELNLPNQVPDAGIILVRGCRWRNDVVVNWHLTVLESAASIPEDVRSDLIGSRQKILFVEGTSSSLDQPLYSTLFPKVSVRSRESCTEVRRAVVGLRSVQAMHNADVFGLVDNDAMSSKFQEKLVEEGVYPLPLYSVESLYYCDQVLGAVAERQASTFSRNAADLLSVGIARAIASLKTINIEHLAARVAERQLRDQLLAEIPSREKMIEANDGDVHIRFASTYPRAKAKLELLIKNSDFQSIVTSFPLRETSALTELAKGLLFQESAHYQQAALAIITSNDQLKHAMAAKLGSLHNLLV
jgi:ABC-type ATPase involved in cell division